MPPRATDVQRRRWHERHAKACACRPIPKSVANALRAESRHLADLDGIGKAMLKDFNVLGINSVGQLAKANPRTLYDRLCRMTGTRQDPCVLDTFTCAVAQARDPHLPKAQRNWWYWSQKRLSQRAK